MASTAKDDYRDGTHPEKPLNGIGTVLDTRADADAAIRSLESAGFSPNAIAVYEGQEGLGTLGLRREPEGAVATAVEAIESRLGGERRFRDALEKALSEGKCYLTVRTDASDEHKQTVESILKAHNAGDIRFFGTWSTEHL